MAINSGRPILRRGGLMAVAMVLTASAAAPIPVSAAEPVRSMPKEMFSPDGTITAVTVDPSAQPVAPNGFSAAVASVTPVEVHGPSENRIDIVFMGDGYTEAELGTFAAQTQQSWSLLAAREPFRSYRNMFNVWRVDVVSPVSGVSGDPTPDIVKDTPLGMTYWCGGLERLVCADIDRVKRQAAQAPGADQIAVLANSAKYGGAGYTDDEVVTFAGGHALASEILPHELGHSVGDLADEYDYYAFPGDGSRYLGPDPWQANITKKDADQLAHPGKKWAGWLGAQTPDGGVIGAFEGGFYTQFGIYRPSENSLMKALRREFNAVSREKMIQSFYATARPIDSATPSGGSVGRDATVTVAVLDVPLKIEWYLDGAQIPQWTDLKSVDLNGATGSASTLTVVVSDPTTWVRDAGYRMNFLKQTISWSLVG